MNKIDSTAVVYNISKDFNNYVLRGKLIAHFLKPVIPIDSNVLVDTISLKQNIEIKILYKKVDDGILVYTTTNLVGLDIIDDSTVINKDIFYEKTKGSV